MAGEGMNPPPLPSSFFGGDNGDEGRTYSSHHGSSYDLNSKIMLTAIVSLSVVVALVIVLHVYARCVLRRRARRRSAFLSITLSQLHSTSEQPKTGLDQSVIDSLPTFKFSKSGTGAADDEEAGGPAECAVCLSALEEEEVARLLPNCRHTFHAECIDKWLTSHSTCPICRTEAEPRPQPEPQEPMVVIGSLPSSSSAAPPMDGGNTEGTSEGAAQCSGKGSGGASTSRLSSFRRMLSMGSARRNSSAPEDVTVDRC